MVRHITMMAGLVTVVAVAAPHAQQVVDRHAGGAQLDRDIDFNLV